MTPENDQLSYLDAAVECYELIRRLKVDDIDDVEGIERAIDLAIARRNEELDPYLFRDLLRNGRFSARRSQARRRRLAYRYAAEQPVATTAKRRFLGDSVSMDSPQSSVEARELKRELDRVASDHGAAGPAVLGALVAGRPTIEAAAHAGISRSTAQRVAARLRSRVSELGYRAA